jgi:excisionase family DNA binding protein
MEVRQVNKMSMIIERNDLKRPDIRQKLIEKILANFEEIAVSPTEAYQIDIYPVKNKTYYTTGEVAKVFQVSDRMVRKWCEQGRVRALQTPGGAWRIYASQFPELQKVQNFQKTAGQINERFQEYPEINDFE